MQFILKFSFRIQIYVIKLLATNESNLNEEICRLSLDRPTRIPFLLQIIFEICAFFAFFPTLSKLLNLFLLLFQFTFLVINM